MFLEADIFYFLRDPFQPFNAYTPAHDIVIKGYIVTSILA
jgi:hypothetical protein